MSDIDITSPNLKRPTSVAHPTIDAIADAMREAGREELVHYAGASYRDDVAWQVCLAWLADRGATGGQLRSRALRAAYGWNVSPESLQDG